LIFRAWTETGNNARRRPSEPFFHSLAKAGPSVVRLFFIFIRVHSRLALIYTS
jgi:hypothetical protein